MASDRATLSIALSRKMCQQGRELTELQTHRNRIQTHRNGLPELPTSPHVGASLGTEKKTKKKLHHDKGEGMRAAATLHLSLIETLKCCSSRGYTS